MLLFFRDLVEKFPCLAFGVVRQHGFQFRLIVPAGLQGKFQSRCFLLLA